MSAERKETIREMRRHLGLSDTMAYVSSYRGRSKGYERRKQLKTKLSNRKWDWNITLAFGWLSLGLILSAFVLGEYGGCVVKNAVRDHLQGKEWNYMYDVCQKPLLRPVVKQNLLTVKEAHAEEPTVAQVSAKIAPTATGKEYYSNAIRQEAQKAGVKPQLAERLIALIDKCENSSWNPEAVNTANRNGSRDVGIAQINSIHAERIFNVYQMSFDEAMKDGDRNIHYAIHHIVKPQGNLSAWACDRLLDSNNERIEQ